MKFEGSIARNARFDAANFQGERSFSRFAWQAQDFGSSLIEKLKSLVRNARFGGLFLEKLRKSRTKCSFWKLVP